MLQIFGGKPSNSLHAFIPFNQFAVEVEHIEDVRDSLHDAFLFFERSCQSFLGLLALGNFCSQSLIGFCQLPGALLHPLF